MTKTNDELLTELEDLKQKYTALEEKHKEEINIYKKNEEDLRLRLLFLEGIANSVIDGYLVVNPYGQKILQNQRTIDLWKIPQNVAEDPSGLKQVEHVMKMVVNPQQFVAEIDYLREHPNDKTRDEIELVDGTILDRYSSPVIGLDGKNYGRIWTFHDVTERKKAETQLIQLNTDKERFISILAHDLKNPFSSLLGFSELLLNNLEKYPIQKTKTMVEAMHNIANKTYKLLEDTLLWANLKSKNILFNRSIFDINEIISEVADLLEPVAKLKNISIEHKSDDKLPINADIYMIKAIIRNLVSNAIKFTREGGKIEISAIQNTPNIIIEVTDNGVGMPPEVIDKLFNISLIKSTIGTAHETGTGLGLMLCKEFVENHDGEIWINSKIDIGTTVRFTIPNQV
ncbi:MAG: hypothetical protein IPO21_03535 [Bacteroidales bacterium]|nr:hypothetical protein [Bacteroidales bacterium]